MLDEEPRVQVEPIKPRLRGRLHQAALFAAIPAVVVLIIVAPGAKARAAAIVYAFGLVGLFGASAAYHRLPWSPRARQWLKRIDHSMIFVLIAATYTPLCLLVLHGPWEAVVLSIAWGGAALGIILKFVRPDGLSLFTSILYGVLGWFAVVAAPQILHGTSPTAASLMLAGGLLYTGGAIVLARNKPDPIPGTFGYHEIWHSCVIAASACHYGLVMLVTLGAR